MMRKKIILVSILPLLIIPALVFRVLIHNDVLYDDMILVRGGTFTVGDGEQSSRYEYSVKDFMISPYEVTNELFVKVYNRGIEWKIIEAQNEQIRFDPRSKIVLQFALLDTRIEGCRIRISDGKILTEPGTEKLPVVGVSWYGAAVFCNLLSKMEGRDEVYDTIDWVHKKKARGYRLPGYEEWEYAARGGSLSGGYTFAGSDDPLEVGWFLQNSEGTVHPVGLKKPNELGLYDMSGNLHEFMTEIWCLLRTENYKPGISGLRSANRMWRGGAWNKQPVSVYFFRQSIDNPNYCLGFSDIGFRPVLEL